MTQKELRSISAFSVLCWRLYSAAMQQFEEMKNIDDLEAFEKTSTAFTVMFGGIIEEHETREALRKIGNFATYADIERALSKIDDFYKNSVQEKFKFDGKETNETDSDLS